MFKKIVSAFLALTFVTTLMPAGLQAIVLAQNASSQVQEEAVREELSDYLLKIVDTEGVTEIVTPDPEPPRKKARSSSLSSEEEVDPNQELILEKKDGSRVAYIFSEDIQYIDENGAVHYKEISVEKQTDDKLKKEGYDYSNGTNDYRINFSSDISKGIFVDNEQVKFSLIPQNTKNVSGTPETIKTLDGDVEAFVYNGIYGEGTALRYFPQLNGLSEAIVLDKYSGQHTFTFSLNTYDLEAVLTEDNAVAFLAPDTKEEVYRLNPAYAYDNFGGEYSDDEHYTEDCTYTLEKVADGKYILTLDVSEEWLTNDNTLYPVTIDPTTSNLSSTKDAAIYSLKASTSFYKATTNCFGRTQSTYGKGRAFIRVPLPSEIKSGASISHAYLWLRETTGRTASTYVRPYMLTEGFYDTTNWNNQPSKSSTSSMTRKNINSNSTDGGPSKMWYRFDIAEAANKWTRGTTNYGVVFVSEEESKTTYNWRAFASREHATSSYHPYMVVSYTNDTKAPTITSVSGNLTAWTKGDVTLKINGASDNNGSGLHATPYSFSTTKGKYSWQAGNTKKFTANQTVYIYTRDKLGNIGLVNTTTINKIDKAAPTITDAKATATSNGKAKITVTGAKDTGSGLHATPYSFSKTKDKYSWQASATSPEFNYSDTVYVAVQDKVGNIAVRKTIDLTDLTPPTISNVSIDQSAMKITVTASDKETGIDSYSFDNGKTWQTGTFKTYSVPTFGIQIKVKDKAGNITSASQTYNVGETRDDANPFIYEENGIYKIYHVNGSTALEYKIGESGTWTSYKTEIPVSPQADTVIYARVKGTQLITEYPVKAQVGIYSEEITDFSFDSKGTEIEFTRYYDSKINQWAFSFEPRLQKITRKSGAKEVSVDSALELYYPDGSKETYLCGKDGTYISAVSNSVITATETGYQLTNEEQIIVFDEHGRLLSVKDLNGNTIQYQWKLEQELVSKLTVTDSTGRVYIVSYAAGKPISITVPGNKTVQYSWADGNLTKVVNSAGQETVYQYTDGKLTDNGEQTISYTGNGRVQKITQRNNSAVTYSYDDATNKVTATDTSDFTTSFTYDNHLWTMSETDENGETTEYTYSNLTGLLASEKDKDGETSYSYKDLKLVLKTNPDETTEQYKYNEKGWLAAQKDVDDKWTTYTYDEKGNILQEKNWESGAIHNEDANELAAASILENIKSIAEDPSVSEEDLLDITEYTYYTDGKVHTSVYYEKKETETEQGRSASLPKIRKDTYTYDQYGYPTAVETIDYTGETEKTTKVSSVYDVAGQLLSETSAEGKQNSYVYNKLGQKISETLDGKT
ncbi:MAG: RHS repeat protein, partial [Clostridiales bacterium]|nr:RHS repeat protein [Clostridiales bacterium]